MSGTKIEDAADMTCTSAGPGLSLFEYHLRRAMALMIRVNMGSATGRPGHAND